MHTNTVRRISEPTNYITHIAGHRLQPVYVFYTALQLPDDQAASFLSSVSINTHQTPMQGYQGSSTQLWIHTTWP